MVVMYNGDMIVRLWVTSVEGDCLVHTLPGDPAGIQDMVILHHILGDSCYHLHWQRLAATTENMTSYPGGFPLSPLAGFLPILIKSSEGR